MDEAHSIGALGLRGRGVCDYFDIDPRKGASSALLVLNERELTIMLVDILMGTFTKSFGAAGGYIAGSHEVISALRLQSHAENYAESMAPPVVSQIITSTASIMGPAALQFVPSLAALPASLMSGAHGIDRIRRLAFNCRYVHGCLRKLGFIVYGSHDSPIVPLLVPAAPDGLSRAALTFRSRRYTDQASSHLSRASCSRDTTSCEIFKMGHVCPRSS